MHAEIQRLNAVLQNQPRQDPPPTYEQPPDDGNAHRPFVFKRWVHAQLIYQLCDLVLVHGSDFVRTFKSHILYWLLVVVCPCMVKRQLLMLGCRCNLQTLTEVR